MDSCTREGGSKPCSALVQRQALVRITYTPLGNNPLLQTKQNSERRGTILYKQRAAEAMAHHIMEYLKVLGIDKYEIGRDGLLWWKDLGVPPTRRDKDILMQIVSCYELQARTTSVIAALFHSYCCTY